MARLGGLIEQIRGVSYKPEDIYDDLNENSITLLRANNIQDGQLNFDDVVYVDKKRVHTNQLLQAGDTLICTSSGSKELVGKAAYVQEAFPMTFGAFCKVVRPKKIYSKYLGHFFNSPYYRQKISESSAGANINNIRNEHVDELEIVFPSKERQQYVADVLDKVSNLISLRKQQLAKLDELVKARFVEMFETEKKPFPVVELGNVAKLQGGYAFKSSDYVENGIRLVQIANVNKDTLNWDICNYVPESFLNKYGAFCLQTGDIVLAMTRPVIKSLNSVKIARVTIADVPSLLNQRVGRFQINESVINSEYLVTLCQMESFKKYAESMSGNSLQPNISSKQVEQYKIFLPPLKVQDEFSTFIKLLEKPKLTIQQSLDKLEVLKKLLMQEYFG